MSTPLDSEAKRILDRRFASGEITKEQYVEMLRLLGNGGEMHDASRPSNDVHIQNKASDLQQLELIVNKKLSFYREHISYEGETLDYKRVYSIYQYAYRHSINFIPIINTSELRIQVIGHEPIVVKSGLYELFISRNSPARKAYLYLSERTYKQRLDKYLRRLKSKGHIDLSLSPSTRLFSDGTLTQELLLGKVSIRLDDRDAVLNEGDPGIFSSNPYAIKVSLSHTAELIQFDCHIDHDVIISILSTWMQSRR